jgi:hypothetical protein
MLTLRELQASFYRSVTEGVAEELLALVEGDGFDPGARLAVYRNNVWSRLTDALRTAYPIICKLVDPRFFEYTADAFIREYPPVGGCLVEYGCDFPGFLAEFPPAAGLTYLPDVARLEWSISQVVRAAPEVWQPISLLRDLRGDPASVRLRLTPCVQFLRSDFRMDQIWIAHQENSDPSHWHIDSGAANLSIQACESLRLNIPPRGTWEFRSHLADGDTLGRATSVALDVDPEFDISQALASLFEEHLVVAIGR